MVKVGLVGLGFMGTTHAQSYQLLSNARLEAVADPEEERRREFAAKYGAKGYSTVEEMLDKAEINAVDICVPSHLHRGVLEKAASAGKHVLCEKPIALTLEDADAMIEAARSVGVFFMVGHVLRFWPDYIAVKKVIDSGRLGPIQWMSAARLSPPPTWSWKEWLFNPAQSGGAVIDLHIHDLDMFAYLAGPPSVISAAGRLSARGALDTVSTTSTWGSRDVFATAEASLAMPMQFPFTMALTVVCEKGTVEFHGRMKPPLQVIPVEGAPEVPEIPSPAGEGASIEATGNIQELGGYFSEIEYFVNCVQAGKEPQVVTPQDARLALAMCLAARESALQGKPVPLQ